jgi:hypothetical protein
LLDLNSGAKGGLLLSNVNITNLDSIPAGTGYFPGVNTLALRDVNPELRGAIVYNTNETTGAGVYVWNGKWWWQAATPDNEQIALTVHTTDNTYSIPTAGYVGGIYHTYDWDITVDGQPAGRYAGAGGGDFEGINLTLDNGDHKIRITPHGGADPGWGNAFGYCDSTKGAHTAPNKQKLISIDAPITTMAFAPKIAEPESTTNASGMFAWLFTGCSNLTTPAVILDTYKLPETITNLSYFLFCIHFGNSTLKKPVDLASLSGWFNGNNSITNLSAFLAYTHFSNSTLIDPINLEPLSGWFNENTSIDYLLDFLFLTHSNNNALVAPIDLAPLSGWFNGNQKIVNMANFLSSIHYANTIIMQPIDLEPLTGWFKNNISITNLVNFLNSTHAYNDALDAPIDLEPLSGWFNGNNNINNLQNFLANTHTYNFVLTAPVDLCPLSGWFTAGRFIDNLTGFLSHTHYYNSGFTLSSDQKIFPNWIKTMKQTQDAIDIWNVPDAFFRTFAIGGPPQTNHTEPLFEDGSTTLSSLGNPTIPNTISIDQYGSSTTNNKGTYTNRGITPDNGHNSWIDE